MSDLVAVVRVQHGLWLADCPRPGCGNAEHFGAHPITGHTGGLRPEGFWCGSIPSFVASGDACGAGYPVVWPARAREIEALLCKRPFVSNRNWRPGESIADLIQENFAHGVEAPIDDNVLVAMWDEQVPELTAAPVRPAIESG